MLKLASITPNNMFSLDFATNLHLQWRYVNWFKIVEGSRKHERLCKFLKRPEKMLILHLYTRFYLLKLSKIKKYMSAGKKDCARSLYNVFVVLSLPERSGRDKFFFLSLCFL